MLSGKRKIFIILAHNNADISSIHAKGDMLQFAKTRCKHVNNFNEGDEDENSFCRSVNNGAHFCGCSG